MDSIWQYGEYMMSSKWDWQGKTKQQVESSTWIAGISVVAMIVVILVSWIMKVIN